MSKSRVKEFYYFPQNLNFLQRLVFVDNVSMIASVKKKILGFASNIGVPVNETTGVPHS